MEERERLIGDAHENRFNFIREFARYDLNDYPLYVQKPKFGVIVGNIEDIKKPQLRFTDHSNIIDKEYRFYSCMINGHSFVIPTSNQFMNERLSNYKEFLVKTDDPFGIELIQIRNIEDLDFRFSYMNK